MFLACFPWVLVYCLIKIAEFGYHLMYGFSSFFSHVSVILKVSFIGGVLCYVLNSAHCLSIIMFLCFHIVLAPSACLIRVFVLIISFDFEHSGSYYKIVGAFSAGHVIYVCGFLTNNFFNFVPHIIHYLGLFICSFKYFIYLVLIYLLGGSCFCLFFPQFHQCLFSLFVILFFHGLFGSVATL